MTSGFTPAAVFVLIHAVQSGLKVTWISGSVSRGLAALNQLFRGFVLLNLGACGELGYQIVLSGHTDREGAVRDVAQGLLAQVSFDEPSALGTVDDVNSFCHFLSPYCLM
jgi:hypothetical protein